MKSEAKRLSCGTHHNIDMEMAMEIGPAFANVNCDLIRSTHLTLPVQLDASITYMPNATALNVLLQHFIITHAA